MGRKKGKRSACVSPGCVTTGSAGIAGTNQALRLQTNQNLRALNRDKAISAPRSRMNTERVQGIYAKIKSRNDIMRNVGYDDKTGADVEVEEKERESEGEDRREGERTYFLPTRTVRRKLRVETRREEGEEGVPSISKE